MFSFAKRSIKSAKRSVKRSMKSVKRTIKSVRRSVKSSKSAKKSVKRSAKKSSKRSKRSVKSAKKSSKRSKRSVKSAKKSSKRSVKSAKKSSKKRSAKSSKKRSVKSVSKRSKDDMYHVSLRLKLNESEDVANPPTREDFLSHLQTHFKDSDMYGIIDYFKHELLVNPVLSGDKLTFDVPKSIVKEYLGVANKENLKRHITSNSLADGSWESRDNNFFHMMDESGNERATISMRDVEVK